MCTELETKTLNYLIILNPMSHSYYGIILNVNYLIILKSNGKRKPPNYIEGRRKLPHYLAAR